MLYIILYDDITQSFKLHEKSAISVSQMSKCYKFWLLKWHPSYAHASKFTKSKHTGKTKIALYYILTPYPKNRLVIKNVTNINKYYTLWQLYKVDFWLSIMTRLH